jgi:hypothetical protein
MLTGEWKSEETRLETLAIDWKTLITDDETSGNRVETLLS